MGGREAVRAAGQERRLDRVLWAGGAAGASAEDDEGAESGKGDEIEDESGKEGDNGGAREWRTDCWWSSERKSRQLFQEAKQCCIGITKGKQSDRGVGFKIHTLIGLGSAHTGNSNVLESFENGMRIL